MRTILPDGSRTAKSRVPHGLVGRLLHDLGAGVAHLLEGCVEVVGMEVDPVQSALGDQRGERVVVGGTAVEVVGEDDPHTGLGRGADGDPAEVALGDVVAELETKRVAIEAEREVGVVDEHEAGGKREVHAPHITAPSSHALLRSCSVGGWGRVRSLAMQPGTPASALWSRRRCARLASSSEVIAPASARRFAQPECANPEQLRKAFEVTIVMQHVQARTLSRNRNGQVSEWQAMRPMRATCGKVAHGRQHTALNRSVNRDLT